MTEQRIPNTDPPIPVRHERVRANGLTFHVATCGEGENLALCLHGFPECWFSWRCQLPFLARLGYRVWAPDLRGYGDTDRPRRTRDYAIERLLEDVDGLIAAADPRSTVLVGHDWGALIAWYYAMRRPTALDRLVILNVPHPAVFTRRLWRPGQLRRSWYVFFFQVPWLPERWLSADGCRRIAGALIASAVDRSRFPPDVLEVYRRSAARPGALTAMLDYYRALVRGRGLLRQRRLGYPVVETPTLMIWGTEDRALGIETTYGTDRHVRDLTLRYLPGVSHWVQQEAPDAVNTILGEWLSAPRAGRSRSEDLEAR